MSSQAAAYSALRLRISLGVLKGLDSVSQFLLPRRAASGAAVGRQAVPAYRAYRGVPGRIRRCRHGVPLRRCVEKTVTPGHAGAGTSPAAWPPPAAPASTGSVTPETQRDSSEARNSAGVGPRPHGVPSTPSGPARRRKSSISCGRMPGPPSGCERGRGAIAIDPHVVPPVVDGHGVAQADDAAPSTRRRGWLARPAPGPQADDGTTSWTMEPPPSSIICGMACLLHSITLLRFTSITVSPEVYVHVGDRAGGR